MIADFAQVQPIFNTEQIWDSVFSRVNS